MPRRTADVEVVTLHRLLRQGLSYHQAGKRLGRSANWAWRQGRAVRATPPRRPFNVSFQVTADEYDAIYRQARKAKTTLSGYLRDLVARQG